MKHSIRLALLLAGLLVFLVDGKSVAQVRDTDIRLELETPSSRSTHSGISTVRGWALHPTKKISTIEIYIDGVFSSEIPVGGRRGDVYNAFPNAEGSLYSGFSQTMNWKVLEPGAHILEVAAFTEDGLGYNSVEIEMCTQKFQGEFINDYDAVDLGQTSRITMWQRRMILQGVFMEGKRWNVELSWSQTDQDLKITQVTPYVQITNTQTYLCGSPQVFGLTVDDEDPSEFIFEEES